MSNQRINFASEVEQTEPWIKVGVAFESKNGNGFNIIIGNKRPKTQGSDELVETVADLKLVPGDELYLGKATKRGGGEVKTKNGAAVYNLMLKPERTDDETSN